MIIFSLDTSTAMLSLALMDQDRVLAQRQKLTERLLSSALIPEIQALVADAGISQGEVGGIAVGLGPGSFTSLRVGLATVKGLAFAWGCPVVGISSLDAAAMNASSVKTDQVCPLVDAHRSMVYAAVYTRGEEGVIRTSDYLLCPVSEVAGVLRGSVAVLGDGLTRYEVEFKKAERASRGRWKAHLLKKDFWYPSAVAVARLAGPRFMGGQADDVRSLVPMYLYPADCQVTRPVK